MMQNMDNIISYFKYHISPYTYSPSIFNSSFHLFLFHFNIYKTYHSDNMI